jgi:hypothetical protein
MGVEHCWPSGGANTSSKGSDPTDEEVRENLSHKASAGRRYLVPRSAGLTSGLSGTPHVRKLDHQVSTSMISAM